MVFNSTSSSPPCLSLLPSLSYLPRMTSSFSMIYDSLSVPPGRRRELGESGSGRSGSAEIIPGRKRPGVSGLGESGSGESDQGESGLGAGESGPGESRSVRIPGESGSEWSESKPCNCLKKFNLSQFPFPKLYDTLKNT